jgi:hypothetical protein
MSTRDERRGRLLLPEPLSAPSFPPAVFIDWLMQINSLLNLNPYDVQFAGKGLRGCVGSGVCAPMEDKLMWSSDALLDRIVAAASRAVADYLDMTGDAGAWPTPEFWLQAEIARSLKDTKDFYIIFEETLSNIAARANSKRKNPLTWQGARQTGRVDIALYECTEDAKINAVIEVKKLVIASSFDEDLHRIVDIHRICGGQLCGIVIGLYTHGSAVQVETAFNQVTASLNKVGCSRLEKIAVIESQTRGHAGIIAAIVRDFEPALNDTALLPVCV